MNNSCSKLTALHHTWEGHANTFSEQFCALETLRSQGLVFLWFSQNSSTTPLLDCILTACYLSDRISRYFPPSLYPSHTVVCAHPRTCHMPRACLHQRLASVVPSEAGIFPMFFLSPFQRLSTPPIAILTSYSSDIF